MLTLTAVELARSVLWEPRVSIESARETLQMPARLDVNTAREYELMLVPGIGPQTARAIVEYRRTHGPFVHLEDLIQVSGIGPKTLERLRPHLMCAAPRGGGR